MLIDIAFGLALVYGLMNGNNGLFGQITNWWKVALSILIALRFSPNIEHVLVQQGTAAGAHTSLASLVIGCVLLFGAFTVITNNMNKWTGQNFNIFSKGFGFLTYLFFVGIAFSAIMWYGAGTLVPNNLMAESQIYPYIDDLWPIMQCKFQGLLPYFGAIIDGFRTLLEWLFGALQDECFTNYNHQALPPR